MMILTIKYEKAHLRVYDVYYSEPYVYHQPIN